MDAAPDARFVRPMSDRPTRIVTALPPSKRPAPRLPALRVTRPAMAPAEPRAVALLSSQAIAAVLNLIGQWKLPPARVWRMLTGVGYSAGSLTPDQIARVQHLIAINTGMREILGDKVGEWMVTSNPAAVLSGSAPIDFLTRAGTRGYAALARQVGQWVRM